jgi:hypothetical protein
VRERDLPKSPVILSLSKGEGAGSSRAAE